MQKKIIFVEPYASRGGHMWANTNYFQACIHAEDKPYAFIVEKDLSVANRGCLDASLINYGDLIRLPEALRVKTRAQEYSNIVKNDADAIHVFLTNFDFDLTVWRYLLRDKEWRKGVIQNDRLIVVHMTVLTFAFYNFLNECRCELEELSKNMFFSFFSELQPLIVRSQMKNNNCLTLFRVGCDDSCYSNKRNHITAQYLSFLGIYTWCKNPHLIHKAHRVLEDAAFQIQVYPVGGSNAALFSSFIQARRPYDRIICKQLSPNDYVEAIFKTKIGLLPYDDYKYAVQASGLLEDYMFAGIPTVVPQDTWLAYLQSLFNAGGVTFDPNKAGDFEFKIQSVVADYALHKSRAIDAAASIRKERCAREYLDILYILDDKRTCVNRDIPSELLSIQKAVDKGTAYFFTQCADELYRTDDSPQAKECLQRAMEADPGYWQTQYVQQRILAPDSFQIFKESKMLLAERFNVNPHQYIRNIKSDNLLCNNDTVAKALTNLIDEFKWHDYIAVEDIETILPSMQIESLLSIDKWDVLGDPALFGDDVKKVIIKMIINIGELLYRKGNNAWIIFFQRAISLLEDKQKSEQEMHWLASAYAKLERIKEAEQLFLILSENADPKIAGGALFHLGAMMLAQGAEEIAHDYFTRCLNVYPEHGKAREMLGKDDKGAHVVHNTKALVPILLMIYNRPEMTQQVFDAIRSARPKSLFISADGPRMGEEELCQRTRDILMKIDWDCDVHTLYRDKNIGCRRAVSTGISWFFKHVEEGIIFEDDTLPHPSFFQYCEELLAHYRNDTRVMHIAGTNKGYNADIPYSYYFSKHAPIWGWATWRRAWKLYDGEMNYWPLIRDGLHHFIPDQDTCEIRRCNYDYVYQGEVDTWDYQWHLTVLMQHGLAVVPRVNMVSNIGFGEIATHTKNVSSPVASLRTFAIDNPLRHPPFITHHEAFETYHVKN